MAIYAGDRDKAVTFTVATGSVLGTNVVTARLLMRGPSGEAEWSVTVGSATSSSVVLTHVLSAGDVPTQGEYVPRAWLYGAGGTLLCDTDEGPPLQVRAARHTWPT